jgi:hypothetical protein
MVGRRVSDESFDIGLESNCRFSTSGPLQRLLSALTHRQDRSRTVCAAAELLEAVAGAPVDADAADSLLRESRFDA